VDLFYIFERMGRWGSTAWRPSLRPSFVPFGNHRAMALAFQLPAPIGEHKIIPTIIARHTPRSVYWTPVNGASLLALEGPGHTRQAARELLRLGAKALREAQQRFAPAMRAPKQVRLAYLKDHLRDAMQDTLKSSRSLARQLFTPAHIEGLFTDGKGHALDGFSLAGALFSLELWKQALDEASRRGG
jgi:hypothetical protein